MSRTPRLSDDSLAGLAVVGRGGDDSVLGLKNGFREQLLRMFVRQAIEHPGAFAASGHDAGEAELREVLRNGRL
ncbi:hypothetical protein IWX88_000726 [Frigoribacterium sp. CG_9.8]|nr:hypothetical protein [Frigoribacterium sp. CG_9.8]